MNNTRPAWDYAGALSSEGYSGTAALLISDFAGHEFYSLNPDRVFPAASTIKVPLLVLAFQQAQAGGLDLDERVSLKASDRVPGAGVLHELGDGLALSWRDVLTLMIIVSDNTATNLLIDRLGIEEINSGFGQLGLSDTVLMGKLQVSPDQCTPAQRRGERNCTSARDQLRLLTGLAGGRWLTAAYTAQALAILERQQLRDLIGRELPRDPLGQPLYRLASKSGELSGVHHDVGLLYTPRPLAVVLLSEQGSDPREHPENRDVLLLARKLWPALATFGQTTKPPA